MPWEAWTVPQFEHKSPGALGFASIAVAKAAGSSSSGSAAPQLVKPTQPYSVVRFPAPGTYAEAAAATGVNFAASGLNRAVPNGDHGAAAGDAVNPRMPPLYVLHADPRAYCMGTHAPLLFYFFVVVVNLSFLF